jgi:hypothetical protein
VNLKSPLRRTAVLTAGALIGLSGAFALAGPASAHHPIFDSGAPCVNEDGTWQVSWTVVDQLGTAGGVENRPTVNHFSTPDSAPLKPLSVRLQFVNTKSGLQTGYVSISCGIEGDCTVSDRVDVGLPGGEPQILEAQLRDPNRSPLDPMNWHGANPETEGAPGP